ncbi:MAG: hypothetical protein COU47_00760 [Candidatus Niyogibacteria bacterium CG10_big_fil_rev_8_21_14_0_10_46_36]|uniref:Methyltransferase n=1 Tax=Candidatus Niyogibacteria bacterium CG10_big_fil_rev_8_21_14_0_10_46_36 TaxID=1974726 RepID=A0A2H0TEG2_9BACT|nr:MAG: hypothetical protein COU47_00760 [Candidatus Niyogibacteria bacterium CG10_big_fil_rev_8_21_14_0_10_46_36]
MNDVTCRVCGSAELKQFFDLGKQPYANALRKTKDQEEVLYPLALVYCTACSLVQLGYTADPKELFSEYVWVTGTSKRAHEHAETFYREYKSRVPGTHTGYVLEIASNDGTFLLPFQRNGHAVLGVDPAKNIVAQANKDGIPTEAEFFGETYVRGLLKREGPASFVFARNVLPHVVNTVDFVRGVRAIMNEDAVCAIEFHYAGTILEELHYDSIYHEHLCYFTLRTMERLLRDNGLFVYDVFESPISGGSLVVYAAKKSVAETDALRVYRSRETEKGINNYPAWEMFRERSCVHRDAIRETLFDMKKKGERVVGYGASARSSTLLNFCDIDDTVIAVIADANPLKQGLYTAGTHIPITSPEKAMAEDPSCIILLGWNFADEIMEYVKKIYGYRGSYYVPLPGMPRLIK